MSEAFIIGAACTSFGKKPDENFKDLTKQVFNEVVQDAGDFDAHKIEQVWFGNVGMHVVGQSSIRGQVCFTPLVQDGSFPERVPVINVEGGCATGSLAIHGAWKDIMSGQADVSLAIGVEKLFFPDNPAGVSAVFDGAIDQMNPESWISYYQRAGKQCGKEFDLSHQDRSIFMDTYAMQAAYHMKKFGSTQQQLAVAASKSHAMGARNPLAQYRFELSPEEILNDRMVSWPLTRSMCAPIGDGAAAVLLCSAKHLASLPPEVRERAVKIKTSILTGGKYRSSDEPSLSRIAAQRAYKAAGIGPEKIDIAEVHDATSFSEIYQCEMLGFCPEGEGGIFVESGSTHLDGEKPINLSGGLVSKGHPVGATGLSMIYETALQLRGEAGDRQRIDAHLGLIENGGGVIGFDEAICSVTILERGGD